MHLKGFLRNDLKASNVARKKSSNPVMIDFG